MIYCHRLTLAARCQQRGYLLDDVMPCVIAQDGDIWTVDETHAAYPARKTADGTKQFDAKWRPSKGTVTGGPGTELSKLLARWGIKADAAGCKCRQHAAVMDHNGCDWCEANVDTIAGWLREEAKSRGLPFVDSLARLLVRRAIHNARKAEAARAKEAAQSQERPAV